jgi:hypothetical protein
VKAHEPGGSGTPSSAVRVTVIGLFSAFLIGCDGSSSPVELQREWELWPRGDVLPPEAETEFLSFFGSNLGNPEFCDAYQGQPIDVVVRHEGVEWKGSQGLCDTHLSDTVVVNQWLAGIIGVIWVHNTVNAEAMLRANRLVAIEIDGERIPVTVDDIVSWTTPDGAFDVAVYNVHPRFTTTGLHSVKYIYRQEAYFFFHYDHDLQLFEGYPDLYPGFEGRRVFIPEVVGDPVDGYMIASWTLNVVAE